MIQNSAETALDSTSACRMSNISSLVKAIDNSQQNVQYLISGQSHRQFSGMISFQLTAAKTTQKDGKKIVEKLATNDYCLVNIEKNKIYNIRFSAMPISGKAQATKFIEAYVNYVLPPLLKPKVLLPDYTVDSLVFSEWNIDTTGPIGQVPQLKFKLHDFKADLKVTKV
eukprot:CAMPEP_0176467064 /NCGR_PEP_ID=MMETSP0127-20121128/38251_1 /TAXON_ID=938130 /ORGANISM="Platyophrya macrostoma, Strain WH" /LENGTH=168 /DNA_ID=CAMNT_0017860323 /DNA_START=14 /DNA_END=516 /DNA_ORIENTATION=+